MLSSRDFIRLIQTKFDNVVIVPMRDSTWPFVFHVLLLSIPPPPQFSFSYFDRGCWPRCTSDKCKAAELDYYLNIRPSVMKKMPPTTGGSWAPSLGYGNMPGLRSLSKS